MAGKTDCTNYKLTHEETEDKKCLLSSQQSDGIIETSDSPSTDSDLQISSGQAQATASQVMIGANSQSISQMSNIPSSDPDPTLAKLSQRLGHLKEHAAKDRQVLTGLVSVRQTGNGR